MSKKPVHFYDTKLASSVLIAGSQQLTLEDSDTLAKVVAKGGKQQFHALLGRCTPGEGKYTKIGVDEKITLGEVFRKNCIYNEFAVVGYTPRPSKSQDQEPSNSSLPNPENQNTKQTSSITVVADQSDTKFNLENTNQSAVGNNSSCNTSNQPQPQPQQSSSQPSRDIEALGNTQHSNENTAGINQTTASTSVIIGGRTNGQAVNPTHSTHEQNSQKLVFLVPKEGSSRKTPLECTKAEFSQKFPDPSKYYYKVDEEELDLNDCVFSQNLTRVTLYPVQLKDPSDSQM